MLLSYLRFLESLEDNQKIDGAIFVAGFGYDLEHEGYKGELSSFFRTPIDWNKIKTKANKFVIIHSKDDEWVPIEHNKIYQEKLGAEGIILMSLKNSSKSPNNKIFPEVKLRIHPRGVRGVLTGTLKTF